MVVMGELDGITDLYDDGYGPFFREGVIQGNFFS
jgi:hypothetical protein